MADGEEAATAAAQAAAATATVIANVEEAAEAAIENAEERVEAAEAAAAQIAEAAILTEGARRAEENERRVSEWMARAEQRMLELGLEIAGLKAENSDLKTQLASVASRPDSPLSSTPPASEAVQEIAEQATDQIAAVVEPALQAASAVAENPAQPINLKPRRRWI